jgi:hypothetical protein
MALEFILQENVLTDNVLIIAEENKRFKGNYIAIIEENKYQNAWSDYKEIIKFRSKKQLINFLTKKYPDVEIDFSGTCID